MVLTVAEAKKLTVPRLKEELTKRGLDSVGNKPELLDRLVESIEQAVEDSILNDTAGDLSLPNDDILNDDILDAASIDGVDELLGNSGDAPAAAAAEGAAKETTELKESSQEAPAPTTTPKSGEDAKLARAARFGLPITGSASATALSSDTAKEARAKRFGGAESSTPVANSEVLASDEAKASRAARFGTATSTDSSTKEKLAARAARFGLPLNANGKTTEPTGERSKKLEDRAKRFGLVDEDAEAKKKARLERFAS